MEKLDYVILGAAIAAVWLFKKRMSATSDDTTTNIGPEQAAGNWMGAWGLSK